MDVTKRNHYNPCFWTALWNVAYYHDFILTTALDAIARDQVVHVLNIKSQKVYPTTVERVHYDKNLGIAEITKCAAKEFVQRYHPDHYERFEADCEATSYPVYLDFENIFTGIEATPPYQTGLPRILDFPEFSRHLIMSKLNWRVVNERYKIYSRI